MERTVPTTASDEIELYLRTVFSVLRSTTEVQIRSLEEVHSGMNSSLHLKARQSVPDVSALIYASLRLPECMPQVQSVVLGQNPVTFIQHGIGDVENWEAVSAHARRRRCYFDGKKTLACYIASRSDIEDVIPVLTAYQIEWNKLHVLLQDQPSSLFSQASLNSVEGKQELAQILQISLPDLDRLLTMLGDRPEKKFKLFAQRPCSLGVRLLSGSFSEYKRATRIWWRHVESLAPNLL
jgi:hypothetical protein